MDYEGYEKAITHAQSKITQAVRIRHKLISEIFLELQNLKKRPYDEDARRRLMRSIGREEYLLEIVLAGIKDNKRTLEHMRRELKGLRFLSAPTINVAKMFVERKREMESILGNLEDALEFVKRKSEVIKGRLSRLNKIVENPDMRMIERVIEELREESELDMELSRRLNGELSRIHTSFERFKEHFGKTVPIGGLSAGLSYIGTSAYFNMVKGYPNGDTQVLAVIFGLCAMLMGTAAMFCKVESEIANAESRPIDL